MLRCCAAGLLVILTLLGLLRVEAAAEKKQVEEDPSAAKSLTAAELYPLAQGSEWHYVMESEKGEWEMSYQAAKLPKEDDAQLYRIEMLVDGKIVLTEHVSQTPKGLYRNRYQDAILSPPLLLLRNPVKPGETWTTKTQIGAQELSIDCKTGREKVETPAGTYNAVKLTVTTRADDTDIRSDYWFAPNVGIVKQVAHIGDDQMSISLKKYQPGNTPSAPAK